MKLVYALGVGCLLAGATAYADTVTGTGAFSAFNLGTRGSCTAGVCTDGTPFFYDTSGDIVNGSNQASAGDFLGAVGSFAGGINYMAGGGQMYTQSSNSPNYASAFDFIRQAAAVEITLLYANSSVNNNAEIGLYDASSSNNAIQNHTIVQNTGTNLNAIIGQVYDVTNPYATYGIYVRTCTVNAANNACPGQNIVTYFDNLTYDQNVPAADVGHQHWALFQSGTNANIYYLALEDYALQGSQTRNPTEGYGDYNDIILELNTSPVPEPGTISIVGLGLVGLGFLGRRVRKN